MKLNEVGVRTETIYWEWPFETDTCPMIENEKLESLEINKEEYDILINEKKFTEANDMIDTAESSNQVSMAISVIGKQVNGEPRLSDLVQVGDYVNYNALAYDENGKTYSYNTESDLTGSTTVTTFNSSDEMQWRVLSVDRENGKIELISADVTSSYVKLEGGTGFTNAETVLNKIGAVYGHGIGAINGRSITIEDIQQYSSYNVNASSYGNVKKFITGKFFKEIKNAGIVTGYEKNLTDAQVAAIDITNTYYSYDVLKYFTNIVHDMLFKKPNISAGKPYWIASKCAYIYDGEYCSYAVRNVSSNGKIGAYELYDSAENVGGIGYRVTVVVNLLNNIKTTGQDENGVWQLKVD